MTASAARKSKPGHALPRVIGHRGACGLAPENTIASFRKAAELGVRWVEFDVHLSADGIPVVIHDDTVNRTTDPVDASPEGDARFDTQVDLPQPCIAPIVFVTSPGGAWFATTGD